MDEKWIEKAGGLAYFLSRIDEDFERRMGEYEEMTKTTEVTEDAVAKYVSGFVVGLLKKTELENQAGNFLKKVAKNVMKDYVAEKFFGENK